MTPEDFEIDRPSPLATSQSTSALKHISRSGRNPQPPSQDELAIQRWKTEGGACLPEDWQDRNDSVQTAIIT